jgi:hypothetical protein
MDGSLPVRGISLKRGSGHPFTQSRARRALAQDIQTPAARASMLLIAAQYRVLAERVRQAEQSWAEMDC